MKVKTTIKNLKNNYSKVIKLGYCQAQNLFPEREAVYYNSGVYGWNFDGFVVPTVNSNILIVSGYRNGFGVIPDAALVSEFETKARNLDISNREEYLNNLHELQNDFVNTVLG